MTEETSLARASSGSSSSRPGRPSPATPAPGLDGATLDATAAEIIDLRQNLGVDVAVVVGGGNFWRGRDRLARRAWTQRSPTTSACSGPS